jgi:hypothetical protein
MSEARGFHAFIQELHAEIVDRAGGSDNEAAYRENAFTQYVLEFLEETGVVTNSQSVFLETRISRGTARINGYAISDEEDSLDLFATLYEDADVPLTVGRPEIRQAIEQAMRFLTGVFDGLAQRLEVSSEQAAMASHITSARDNLIDIRINLLTDGVTPTAKSLDDSELAGKRIRFEIWDAERLYRAMQAGRPRDEIVIDFAKDYGGPLPCLEAPPSQRDYSGYLALIPGEVMYQLYDDYGARLLELNVRSFLSARGAINSGIRSTLREEPGRFMAYNNGVVITADELEVEHLADGRAAITRARGLQIVNGGQTTASIHRARKVDRADISSVFVPAKITVIDPERQEAFVRQVSKYANTQNVIQIADFSANEPFHVELERLSRIVWCPGEQGRWFYERARGQYQVEKAKAVSGPRKRAFETQTPPTRRFIKTDVARYEHTWTQKPHVVSLGAQKNFDVFMHDMRARQKDWLPDDDYYRRLIAKAILFRGIERIVRPVRSPASRVNIVTYLMAYLVHRSASQLDLDMIWRTQALTPDLESLLRSWSQRIVDSIVQTAAGGNVTEWCKKEPCWRAIRDLELPFPAALPPEITGRSSTASGQAEDDGKVTAEDLENMDICRKADGPIWLLIYGWGRRTGSLKHWETGIARTLSTYAAQGWPNGISPKQAKHGVRILALARESGALEGHTST